MADMVDLVKRGDIVLGETPRDDSPGMYQANGRFGCVYGKWGLHQHPTLQKRSEPSGKEQFFHLHHYSRARYNSDFMIPLGVLFWDKEPTGIAAYARHHSLYDGTVTTSFSTPDYAVSLCTWFDPVDRRIAGYTLDVKGAAPSICFATVPSFKLQYDDILEQSLQGHVHGQQYSGRVHCRERSTDVAISTTARLRARTDGVCVDLAEGRNEILLAVGDSSSMPSAAVSLERTRGWWHKTWNKTSRVELPDTADQALLMRSLAYLLSTCSDEGNGMTGVFGFTSDLWPHSYFFYNSFITPVLNAMGHQNVSRRWVEYWASRLEGMKEYTRRLFRTEGIFAPLAFPYGSFDGFHDPSFPNGAYCSLHTIAPLCRMAHETATMVDDPDWTERFAKPLVRETALFFKGISRKGEDGLWHLYLDPSTGHDSMGGRNHHDYLCALYSARYCLEIAVAHGLDKDGGMRRILDDGLAFAPLLMKNGVYKVSREMKEADFGLQHHTPQHHSLAFYPAFEAPGEPEKTAYQLRYAMINTDRVPYMSGWTFGELLLCASHLGDRQGWQHDWSRLDRFGLADPDHIQMYEHSNLTDRFFYLPLHALFANSVIDNLASCWWKGLQLGHCVVWSGPVQFENLRMLCGVTVGGSIRNGELHATMTAWKDTAFVCEGRQMALAKGEQRTLSLVLP